MPYRVAAPVIPDEKDLQNPSKTRKGKVWVRWRSLEDDWKGWSAMGTRRFERKSPVFWEKLVAIAIGDRRIDACHAIGPGVLAVSGVGFTAASGFAQRLLHECLLEAPDHWVQTMAPAVLASGYVLTKRKKLLPVGRKGGSEDVSLAIRAGSDGVHWSPVARDVSRTWVECCSELLRDKRMDEPVLRTCYELPQLLSPASRLLLGLPERMATGWGWTVEQQALWTLCLSLAMVDVSETETLITECVSRSPRDAARDLDRMAFQIDCGYTDRFAVEFRRIYRQLSSMFGFHLEEI